MKLLAQAETIRLVKVVCIGDVCDLSYCYLTVSNVPSSAPNGSIQRGRPETMVVIEALVGPTPMEPVLGRGRYCEPLARQRTDQATTPAPRPGANALLAAED